MVAQPDALPPGVHGIGRSSAHRGLFLIGQQWYQAHLRDARLAAQQSAIEKNESGAYGIHVPTTLNTCAFFEASAFPRAYMNVRREEEERNVEVRDNYSSAHQALPNAMPDSTLSVREGWGTNDLAMVATSSTACNVRYMSPFALVITPT